MDCISKRRLAGTAALALLAGVLPASPAAAESRCTAPKTVAWHSCLSTAHRAIDDGPELRLTKARPRLVVRYDRCPARIERRTVVLRTDDGLRVARERVRARCTRGIVRFTLNLRLSVDLTDGTVVRSRWSRVPDSGDVAPRVALEA